ncbi:TP53-binding protein 1-like [Ptychodera flava]|uniref:TP53-binding protein 1-like n=1 Tax=Ptychodera flava TaxID=63121 RepID=UPI00396A810C
MLSSPPGSSAEDEAGKGRPFLGPGVSVFARWQDSFYYPGIVLSEEKNDKFKVKFEDGDQRSVAEKDLIIKGWLEKYSSVMAASTDEDFYEPGVVVGYYKNYDTEEEGYVIEKDEGDAKRYSRKNVILTSDQAALHINPQKLKTPSHGISLDNLITGKRSRNSSAKKASTTPSRRAKGSEQDVREGDQNVQKQESIKRKLAGRESDNVRESPRKKGKVANTRNLTVDVEGTPKVNVLPSTPPPFDETDGVSAMATARSSSRQLRRSPRKLSSVTPTQGPYTSPVRIGPIPAERDPMPTDRTLLKNYGFLLTCGEKKKPPIVPTSQGDWSDESLPEEDVPEVPFDKDLITKLIRAGGGKVLKSFDDAIKFPKRAYLLANTYCRTKKYFQCLAAGISCVSHVWLRDCCQVNQLLEITAYLLPAGENIEENRIMEVQPTNTVLRGLRVLVISRNTTDPDFEDFWTSVLLAAKCAKVSKLPVDFSVSKQPRKSFNYEVIVTDASCPEDLIDKASQLDIPVVGCEWVIQCLINGRRMAYDGHPRYRYQYCP